MLSTYIFSGTVLKILGFIFIFVSDYFLSDELFVEQQSILRYLIGISAILTIGSDVSYRRYLHEPGFHMSFLLTFAVIILSMICVISFLSGYFDILHVSMFLLLSGIIFRLIDFLKAEFEYLRDKSKVIIFDLLSGPLVRYSVLILFLFTELNFEFLLFACFLITFGVGNFLIKGQLKFSRFFDLGLCLQISKLTLSYIPNRMQVFILEFLAVSAVVASYTPEISRLYFIVFSYCAILQIISQSANRWYFRDRVDLGKGIFKQFTKFRILGAAALFFLYIILMPVYLMLFSLDIFDSVVISVSLLLIVNTSINMFQKFLLAELVVIERIWLPNILISLTTMTAPLALLNFDLTIHAYLQILVCSTIVSTLLAFIILRASKKPKT